MQEGYKSVKKNNKSLFNLRCKKFEFIPLFFISFKHLFRCGYLDII